jgi:hypothetical protein
MKGIQGLILAIGLGITGALFNWAYLMNRSSEKTDDYFIGVKSGVTLNPGDAIKAEQIASVGVPHDHAGNLKEFAVSYEPTSIERQSVVGETVSRVIPGGRLLLKDDLKTPRPELKLAPGEEAMFVPIDTRSIITSLIVPGDHVMFLVSKNAPGTPTPAVRAAAAPAEPAPDPNAENENDKPAVAIEKIGPFKVLSVGNRLGSVEVMKSARVPQLQENIMTISVTKKDDKNALYLQSRLEATNFRQVGVRLLPREK